MREIKFRAWDKLGKHGMCRAVGFKTLNYPSTIVQIEYVDEEGDLYTKYRHQGDYELMQYTGLKDKNGVEIYEGDIVVKNEYLWFDNGVPNYRGTIEWVFSQWQVIAHCINPLKSGISDGMNYGMNDDGIEENQNSEWIVIGNIYENAELLQC